MIKDFEFEVIQISYKRAMDVIVKSHYLHRRCPCSIALGLFCGETLVGVAVFGKPASFTLCNGICGKEESKNVIEFSRLWVNDSAPRNTASWFMSRCLKLCPFDIIVSFADSEQGHIGYIYQATNWIYTGESKKQRYFRVKSASSNKGGTQYRRRERLPRHRIIELYGEDAVEEYYSSMKYRYIYFNCSKTRRKSLLKKLKYPILSYPKEKMTWQEQKEQTGLG